MEVKIPPLLSIVAHVSDWRKARGVRYRLHSLFALVVLGLLCGKKGVRAMARYGRGLPQARQKRLGLRRGCHFRPYTVPLINGQDDCPCSCLGF